MPDRLLASPCRRGGLGPSRSRADGLNRSAAHGGNLGDLYLEDAGAAFEVFPGERLGEPRAELVMEWDGVVIVDEHEMRANGERKPALNDLRVFDLAGNVPHIEARVIGRGGSGRGHGGWILGGAHFTDAGGPAP